MDKFDFPFMRVSFQFDHKGEFFLTAFTVSSLVLFCVKSFLSHVDPESCLILKKALSSADGA